MLYAKSHESFESAVEQGLFLRLRELEVIEVPELKLSVRLGQTSRNTTADIAQDAGRVLIKTGTRSVNDQLATELCKFLGTSEDRADTFARVLMAEDADSAEDFLKVRSIGLLPLDLQEALDGGVGPLLQGDQQEAAQDTEEDETADEQATDFDEPPTGLRTPAEVTVPAAMSLGLTMATGPSILGSNTTSETPTATPPAAHPPAMPSASTPASRNENGAGGGETEHRAPTDASGNFPHARNWGSTGSAAGVTKYKRGQSQRSRTKSGRLMSYAASPGDSGRPSTEEDPAKAAAREATGKAAVEYFIATQTAHWQSLTPMPHNNPGFDVQAVAHDGAVEFIEVKGQSAAWTEDGVALTPTELMTAQQKGDRYWLCVVEHVHDEKRRALYLLQNPYGLTQQFRFDSGWKSAAISKATVPMKPEADMYVDIPDAGLGRILSVRKKGRFFHLHVILNDGRQVNKLFNPATMKLSKE